VAPWRPTLGRTHSLAAVGVAAPGQAPPSLAELAEQPGLAATFVIKAGTADRLHQRGQLVEALWLRSAVLLLFEDRNEAALKASRAQSPKAVRARAVRSLVTGTRQGSSGIITRSPESL
jgi:hypothetical protein